MKNRYVKIGLLVLGTTITTQVSAQVKIGENPKNINPNAALEIESANKGLILPRVALTSTTSAVPMTAHVEGMIIYNTATAGTAPNDVTAGYYYNDGNKWVRIADEKSSATDWSLTGNTGTVDGINFLGTTDNVPLNFRVNNIPAGRLDNNSSFFGLRAGLLNIGAGNTAMGNFALSTNETGQSNTAIGSGSMQMNSNGFGNTAVGNRSLSNNNGSNNTALGANSLGLNITGSNNLALGAESLSQGSMIDQNVAVGYRALIGLSQGAGNIAIGANAGNGFGFGNNNIFIGTGTAPNVPSGMDNQINIGEAIFGYNGKIGLGLNAKVPSERLDIGHTSGPINATNPASIRIQGINDAYYAGSSSDKVVVADFNGILKSINQSSLAIEPWQVGSTNTKATTNTQNIYQNANVGIGDFTAANPIAKLDVRGSVRGGTGHLGTVGSNSAAFGGNNTASGNAAIAMGSLTTASGLQATAMGRSTTASGAKSTAMGENTIASGERSVAMGRGTTASGENSIAMGINGVASGENSIAIGGTSEATKIYSIAIGANAKANGESSIALGGSTAIGDGSISMGYGTNASSYRETAMGAYSAITTGNVNVNVNTDALLQVGNGVGGNNSNALTILKNAHTAIGVVGTEAAAKPTELLDLGGTATAGNGGLKIRNINSAAYTGNSATDKVVVADTNGVLKTVKAAMPQFFYMPSIIIPTSLEQLNAVGSGKTSGDLFNNATGQGTIDLHARYTAQFGTPMVRNLTQTTTLPTIAAAQLDYNITWYDINVFSVVAVSNTGIMTYTLAPGADVTVGSFMNIVFSVK